MILSSGNFAVYLTESNVINLLEPRFGNLSIKHNQRRLLKAWYGSRLYTLSALEKEPLEARVFAECKNGGDFLRIIMEEMAHKQGVERWADTTPEHLLHLRCIKKTIPNALIIHIIRDGRDVSLSTDKLGYIHPLPWDRNPSVMVCGLYWQWMVNKGRRDGRDLSEDYTEVRFEDLIHRPRETLARLSAFIEHDLDYDRIQPVGIGSVSAPNSSFGSQLSADFWVSIECGLCSHGPLKVRIFGVGPFEVRGVRRRDAQRIGVRFGYGREKLGAAPLLESCA